MDFFASVGVGCATDERVAAGMLPRRERPAPPVVHELLGTSLPLLMVWWLEAMCLGIRAADSMPGMTVCCISAWLHLHVLWCLLPSCCRWATQDPCKNSTCKSIQVSNIDIGRVLSVSAAVRVLPDHLDASPVHMPSPLSALFSLMP